MAFSLEPFIFLSFLLIVLDQTFGYRGNVEAAKSQLYSRNVVKVSSLLTPKACSTSNPSSIKGVTSKTSLKIVHIHGPCSPLSEGKQNNLAEILHQDQIRVSSIHSRLSKNPHKADIGSKKTTVLESSYRNGDYIVHVGFGTPPKLMTLIFSTGSDITWIQCQPCAISCYNQTDEIFDPSKSTSFSPIDCRAAACCLLKSATGNTPQCGSKYPTCIYGIKYGDSSFSTGYFVSEKLTITSQVIENFQFGCGQRNQGLFQGAAGVLGLGRNRLSFVYQTFNIYGGVFSYCLPTKASSTGYLSLGTEQAGYASMNFTTMISNPLGPSFYFLNVIAVIVGNQSLPISASVFTTSGAIIDSSTTITRLPPLAYATLKSAFQQAMSEYPKAQPFSILDTCYDFTGHNDVEVPPIAFIFQGGAKVDWSLAGVLIDNGQSQVCLAFAANDDATNVAIIGSFLQQEMKVVYDIPNKRVGFGTGTCS